MTLFFKKILVLALSVFFQYAAIAQNKVISVKLLQGSMQYQQPQGSSWLVFKSPPDSLLISQNARIKLANNSSVTISYGKGIKRSIAQPGIWSLLPAVSETASVLNKAVQFLVDKAKKSPFSLDEYAKVSMRQKGVVSRDGECITLMTSPLYGTNLIETTVKFSWNSAEKNSECTFSIYESASQIAQPIYTIDTTGNNVEIDLADLDVVPGQDYYWSATKKGAEKCITYTFRIAEKQVTDKLAAALQELNKELPENPGLHAAASAALYEESNFLENAKNQYEKALQTEPKNTLFKDSYGLFLARNGQVKAAEKILK